MHIGALAKTMVNGSGGAHPLAEKRSLSGRHPLRLKRRLRQRDRGMPGEDVYPVKFQQRTGWMDSRDLTVEASDQNEQ